MVAMLTIPRSALHATGSTTGLAGTSRTAIRRGSSYAWLSSRY